MGLIGPLHDQNVEYQGCQHPQLARTGVSNTGALNKGDKYRPKLSLAFFLLVLVLHSYLPKSSAETSYLPSDLPDASATAF